MNIDFREISGGYTPEEFGDTLEKWVDLSQKDPKYRPLIIKPDHLWDERINTGDPKSPLIPRLESRISEMYELAIIIGSVVNFLDHLPSKDRSTYLRASERMKVAIGRLMIMVDPENPNMTDLFRSAAYDQMRADLIDGQIGVGRHRIINCLAQAGLKGDAIYASTGLRLIKEEQAPSS